MFKRCRIFAFIGIAWLSVGLPSVDAQEWMHPKVIEAASSLQEVSDGNHANAIAAMNRVAAAIQKPKIDRTEEFWRQVDRDVEIASTFDVASMAKTMTERLQLVRPDPLEPGQDALTQESMRFANPLAARLKDRRGRAGFDSEKAYTVLLLKLGLYQSVLLGNSSAHLGQRLSDRTPAEIATLMHGGNGREAETLQERIEQLRKLPRGDVPPELLQSANVNLLRFMRESSPTNREGKIFEEIMVSLDEYYRVAVKEGNLLHIQWSLATMACLKLLCVHDGDENQVRQIQGWVSNVREVETRQPVRRWLDELTQVAGPRPSEVPVGIYPSDPNDPIWKGRPPQ
jgi:hypothetical protein